MTISFGCPNCNASLHAPDEYAGGKARCKNCGTKIRIPTPASDEPDPPAAGASVPVQPSSRRSPSSTPASSVRSIEVACPNCRQRFPVEFAGEPPKGSLRVACDHCGVEKRLSAFQKELGRQTQEQEERQRQREGQIRGVIESTAGMYGDLQGIAGRTLQEIEGLDMPLLEAGDADS